MLYDIFISYRRNGGSNLASYFKSEFDKAGLTSFLDVECLSTGDFLNNLEKAVSKSAMYLLVITEGSLERLVNEDDVVKKEIDWAIKYNTEILPINTIGPKLFELLNTIEGLPDCVKCISNVNTKTYTHEHGHATLSYIIESAFNLRSRRFDLLTNSLFDDMFINFCNKVTNYDLGRNLFYTGILKDNKPYKEGVLVDKSNGLIFEANFYGSALMEGDGKVFNLAHKLIYEGSFSELEFSGYGTKYFAEGTYTGYFVRGKRQGKGKMSFLSKDFYEGTWSSDRLSGYGYMRYANGDEYKGYFEEGLPRNQGVMILANGTQLDGIFNKGKFTKGIKIKDGILYKGSFDDGLQENKGWVYNASNGELIYEGSFYRGKFNGYGTLYIDSSKINTLGVDFKFDNKFLDMLTQLSPSKVSIVTNFKSNLIDTKSNYSLKISNLDGNLIFSGDIVDNKLSGTFHMKDYKIAIKQSLDNDNKYEVNCKFNNGKSLDIEMINDYFKFRGSYTYNGETNYGDIYIHNIKENINSCCILVNNELIKVDLNYIAYSESKHSYVYDLFKGYWDIDTKTEETDNSEFLSGLM